MPMRDLLRLRPGPRRGVFKRMRIRVPAAGDFDPWPGFKLEEENAGELHEDAGGGSHLPFDG